MKRITIQLAAIIIILFFFSGCDKYHRDRYTGTWSFTTIKHTGIQIWSPDSVFVVSVIDTIDFLGSIEPYKTNQLKIIFLPNATKALNGLIYPFVNELGDLSYLGQCEEGQLSNGTISNNDISIIWIRNFCPGDPLGLGSHMRFDIKGKKINKK